MLKVKNFSRWIVPFFFIMLPWDISRVLFPPYQSAPETPSTFTFARIATIILIAWGLLRFIQGGIWKNIRRLGRAPLFWAVVPLFAATFLSLVSSMQPHTTLVEISRLLILCAAGISVALGTEDRKTFERVWMVFFAVATLTAIFGLVQYITGNWIWGGGINVSVVRRVNSTFMDPNIFARYLAVSILGGLLLIVRREWSFTALRVVALLLQIGALVVTFSRTGWIIFFCGIFGITLLGNQRRRWGILIGGGGALLAFLAVPSVRDRLLTLEAGVSALGQRQHLLKGGWAMFIEHPLSGVGLGNFQWAMEHSYRYLVPWSYSVTRSHTTVVTVLAEMGIFGLVAMLVFLFVVAWNNSRVVGQLKPYAWAGTIGIFAAWLSSQGEGRFFEDPLVWGLWGLSLAMQLGHLREDRNVAN